MDLLAGSNDAYLELWQFLGAIDLAGNIVASAYVQPMGSMLAALTVCCVWAGLYVAGTSPLHRMRAGTKLLLMLAAGAGSVLLDHAWQVAVAVVVAALTQAPPKTVQDMVEHIRVPRGAGTAHAH